MDVGSGRFFSPDPIIPNYQDPQSINGYVYVLGNPIQYTDPSGLCLDEDNDGICDDSGFNPRDLTDWLYREMINNAWDSNVLIWQAANKMAEYLAKKTVCDVMGAAIKAFLDGVPFENAIKAAIEARKYQIATAAGLHALALYEYSQAVKDGAKWDFKDETGIKLGPGITLCPEGACYNDIEYSVPGNIHFAYIGVVAGFPGWEIQAGAAYAQITDPAHDPESEQYVGPYNGRFAPGWTPWDPSTWNFGDEPTDHEAVTCGIKMAEKHGAGMTRDQFESELASYIGKLSRCAPDPDPVPEQYARDWPYPVGYFSNQGEPYSLEEGQCP